MASSLLAVTMIALPTLLQMVGHWSILAQLQWRVTGLASLPNRVLQDAEPGTRTHGIVTGVKEYGVFVALWGGLKGLAHSSELGLPPGQTPPDGFQEGQVSLSLKHCLRGRSASV